MAKVLLLLNAGKGSEFKGKSLSQIQIADDTVEIDEEICEEYKIEETNMKEKKTEKYMMEVEKHILGADKDTVDEEIPLTEDDSNTMKKPLNKTNRKRWLPREKKMVLNHFRMHVRNKIPPKKNEVLKFIEKHCNNFDVTDWVRIKTVVYNCYRNQ